MCFVGVTRRRSPRRHCPRPAAGGKPSAKVIVADMGSGSGSGTRHERGSWLNGPGGAAAGPAATGYPGERLGLPAAGPLSVSGLGRRFGAIFLDWLCCLLIVSLITRERLFTPGHNATYTLAAFGAENLILLSMMGSTFGMRVFGIGVRRVDGRRLPLGWVAVRTALLLVVIPAVIYDADQRGYHDNAANSVVVRL